MNQDHTCSYHFLENELLKITNLIIGLPAYDSSYSPVASYPTVVVSSSTENSTSGSFLFTSCCGISSLIFTMSGSNSMTSDVLLLLNIDKSRFWRRSITSWEFEVDCSDSPWIIGESLLCLMEICEITLELDFSQFWVLGKFLWAVV